VPAPRPRAGGWALQDTALAVTALADIGIRADHPAVRRATAWLTSQQANRRRAGATSDAIAELTAPGQLARRPARRDLVELLRTQASDGSWSDGLGSRATDVTCAAVEALLSASVGPGKEQIRRAVGWIVATQNADGGWADQPVLAGQAETGPDRCSTAVATASAVLALVAAGGADTGRSAELGVRWLIRSQRQDGGWDEPQRADPASPGDWRRPSRADPASPGGWRKPPLSRICYPARALGRYLARQSGQARPHPAAASGLTGLGLPHPGYDWDAGQSPQPGSLTALPASPRSAFPED
jgi:squalene cyclase